MHSRRGTPGRGIAPAFPIATVFVLLFASASSAPAQGPVLTVCPDGSGDYLTIQAAVDAAPAGAVIELCDGLYAGDGNRDILLGDRFLTIRSASGDPAACVIDCGGTGANPRRGFLFQAAAGLDTCAVIEGLTVQNGWADTGGGILCRGDGLELGGGPLLSNCRIVACHAEAGGGGIDIDYARLWAEGCEVSGNTGANVRVTAGFCRARDSEFSGCAGNGVTLGSDAPDFAWAYLLRCRLEKNAGSGVSLSMFSNLEADSCTFAQNGWAVRGSVLEDGTVNLRGCEILDNAAGVWLGMSAWGELVDCQVARNDGHGLLFTFAFGQNATRCLVQDNAGDGIHLGSTNKAVPKRLLPAGPVTDCRILGNGGWGVFAGDYLFNFEVSGALIAGNGAGGLSLDLDPEAPAAPAIRSSTIAANNGPGIRVASPQAVTIENTIIAGNTGEAVATPAANVPTLSCSDLFGNTGGDWIGPLATQLGTAGNSSADPLFCDPPEGDYHLASDSPAAPAQSPAGCDLIGALPVGCQNAASTVPHIVSVADIPGDQGRWVRVTWNRDPHDTLGSTLPVARYVVWRRVDVPEPLPAAGRPQRHLTPAGLLPGDGPPRLWAHAALWEPVGPEVPAMGWPQYASVVPTLADSTAAGIAWSVFMISAHTADALLFFLSAPDSGYSVDNLAPAAPLGFAVAYAAAGNQMQWQPHTAPDFVAFRIYRGEGTSFTLPQATLVQTTDATEWTDPVSEPWRWGYLITAVDDSGLESAAAMPATVTSVPGGGGAAVVTAPLPLRPVLRGASPNPFNPRTVIGYALPASGAEVRLEIFDLRGRRLRLLAEGFQGPGRHEAVWDGADAQGRSLPTGLYFCRLRAAGISAVTKLSLVR